MKHSLTILLLLCSMAVIGQSKFDNKLNTSPISQSLTLKLDSVYRIGSGLKYEGAELMPTPGNSKSIFYRDIESKTDTTVLNSGDTTIIHAHEWAYKKQVFSTISCSVYHGDLGCPNNWPVSFRICSLCLRHEKISTTYRYVDKVDNYEEALKRIKD